jgi:hypothetical protein
VDCLCPRRAPPRCGVAVSSADTSATSTLVDAAVDLTTQLDALVRALASLSDVRAVWRGDLAELPVAFVHIDEDGATARAYRAVSGIPKPVRVLFQFGGRVPVGATLVWSRDGGEP